MQYIAIWWSLYNTYGLIKCIAIQKTAIVSEFFINLLFINGSCTSSPLVAAVCSDHYTKVLIPYKAVGTYNRISDTPYSLRCFTMGAMQLKVFPGIILLAPKLKIFLKIASWYDKSCFWYEA